MCWRGTDAASTIRPRPRSMARTAPSANRCCTAAENRYSSTPIALSVVMPRRRAAWAFSSVAAVSVTTAARAHSVSFGIGVAPALPCPSVRLHIRAIGLCGLRHPPPMRAVRMAVRHRAVRATQAKTRWPCVVSAASASRRNSEPRYPRA